MTAAAKGLPLGSTARVTNLKNGRSVDVVINDCGPHRRGRKIDVSRRAAQQLDMKKDGVAPVQISLIDSPADAPVCAGH
jgi:rare lipoprotein A